MSTERRAEEPPTASLVAGKYALVRMIGRGGMGSVWEARHVSLGTRVAIKFVEVRDRGEEAHVRFQNEAKAAATIQSKHAIKVYDHGLLADGRPYLVMELLEGETLADRLTRVGRLSSADTAWLVRQVAHALAEAHERGITHRDLKPDNIFLERGDSFDTAKILDFGIAKIAVDAHPAFEASSHTKTGTLMGTPYFMSPEQAQGLKTVDSRADLWSLGVIVFRCVTGTLPFGGNYLGELLIKICAGPIPVPSDRLTGITPQLDAWMMKALSRDPLERFQSALELAESLAMVSGISVRAPSRPTVDVPPFQDQTEVMPGGGPVSSEPWSDEEDAATRLMSTGSSRSPGVQTSRHAQQQDASLGTAPTVWMGAAGPIDANSPKAEASSGSPMKLRTMATVGLVALSAIIVGVVAGLSIERVRNDAPGPRESSSAAPEHAP